LFGVDGVQDDYLKTYSSRPGERYDAVLFVNAGSSIIMGALR
jgi:hypothetical protein